MSKYDELKKKHAACKEKMTAAEWKKFAIQRKPYYCPICGKR
jgi:hypothetical protein